MVLFVTGLCGKDCFYCPVSKERQERDIIFANERIIEKDEDLIEEAVSMDALGTGITGGEPLLRLDRVLHYIHVLKNRFGSSHHIHLYTALAPEKDVLYLLKEEGLDEIRYHPPPDLWADINNTPYRASIISAYEIGLATGIEIPSISSDHSGIVSLLEEVDGFLNMNELEFSDSNTYELRKRGYVPLDDTSFAVLGSKEVAGSINWKKLHFCSSRFKDAVQFRERLKRIARKNARDFDEITEDGTLVYGVTGCGCHEILKEAGVTDDMYSINDKVIETAWWIVDDLKDELKNAGCKVSVIERYPMKNGMLVEKTPL